MAELYFDNAATSRIDPAVLKAMEEFYGGLPGNASSVHGAGVRSSVALEKARATIAARISASPNDLYFCSGGTEANNLALQGLAAMLPEGSRFLVSAIEHSSILDQLPVLEKMGMVTEKIPVDENGLLNLSALADSIRRNGAAVVSLMHVNNEIGTIQPLAEAASLASKAGALFHVDACQGIGKAPISMEADGIDFLTLSAHKIHGPLGTGALVARRKNRLSPLLRGGGQERGVRPGTINVAGAVGFAKAVELCTEEETKRIGRLRDRLLDQLKNAFPALEVNGSMERRVAHNLNLTFPGKDAAGLASALDRKGAYVSTGSACNAGKRKPSHVLAALSPGHATRDGLRISLGRFTTEAEVDAFSGLLASFLLGKP